MKIKRMYVSNYKNLVDCSVEPTGIHALTGCNGTGKSNFLEVPELIASIISESDEGREGILNGRFLGKSWLPIVESIEDVAPFLFELSATISVQDMEWDVDYHLEIEIPKFISTYSHEGIGRILSESVRMKESTKPGQKKLIINRIDNLTDVSYENSRKKISFKIKSDMSALQAMEVRQADDYNTEFPVLSAFHRSLTAFHLLRINPDKLISSATTRTPSFGDGMGRTMDSFPMYSLLEDIQKRPDDWNRLHVWLKRLCNIDSIEIAESPLDSDNKATARYIFLYQHDRILFPKELSTGSAMLLGLLIAANSFLSIGTVVLEEPETYLHPKAIIDLITLLREISENNTVLFSTHSPVTLNSMQPQEVTVMELLPTGFVTTRKVSELKEAVDALNRGYVSFGDLLQTNFIID